jgi:hypothetical protein
MMNMTAGLDNDPSFQKPEAKTLNDFFVKTAADEAVLRSQYPQVEAVLKQYGVPALVLKRYMEARSELQSRVDFSIDLYRKYADPATGTTTQDPLPLPGFDHPSGVAALMALPDAQIVTADQVLADRSGYALLQTTGDDQNVAGLGFPVVLVAALPWIIKGIVVCGVLLVGGLSAKMIIDSVTGNEARVAFQANQLAVQQNYANVWDVATQVLYKCIGASPTSDKVVACWDDIAKRFPDLVKSIPTPSPPSSFGFFGKLLLLAGAGAAVVGGVWFFRRYQAKKAMGGMGHRSTEKEYDTEVDEDDDRPPPRKRGSNGKSRRRSNRPEAPRGI